MRNRYPGTCYFCGKTVAKGAGHFESNGFIAPGSQVVRWRTIHAECVFVNRKLKEQAATSPRS
jgi:ribosomal protein L24E